MLNEESTLASQSASLRSFRSRGVEIVVADGGSTDRTTAVAREFATQVFEAPRGRASQMNAGARVAHGKTLLFLHADTLLPENADELIARALFGGTQSWGRFDVRIAPTTSMLALVARAMNLRSRLTGIATGDQAIFMQRSTFDLIGGFPDVALMEDVAFSKLAKRVCAPVCLHEKVVTSARRWQKHGVARTILLMWYLRLAYFLGVDTNVLARRYGYAARAS